MGRLPQRGRRSGAILAAEAEEGFSGGQVDLFDAAARGAGGSIRGAREHLERVERELGEVREKILSLEEMVVGTPSRPLQRLLNPSNELVRGQVAGTVATVRFSSLRRERSAWLRLWDAARGGLGQVPWWQVIALGLVLLLLLGLVVWLARLLRG